jgi:hypothetical protein
MTTLTWNILTDAAYKQKRLDILTRIEEGGVPKLNVYVDGKGIPTIGIGFNLRVGAISKAILIFTLALIACNPAFSKEVTKDQKSVEQQVIEQAENDIIVIEKNPALKLCRDMDEILKLPENKGYIISRYIKGMNVFRSLPKIPASYKDFKPVAWQKSSVEEFKKAAPKRYQSIIEVNGRNKSILVEKAILNIDHKKEKRLIFKIKPDLAIGFNIMYMDETNPDSITESFNKNSVGANPSAFFYQGLLYFTSNDGEFGIIEPRIFRDYQPRFYVESICEYQAKEK